MADEGDGAVDERLDPTSLRHVGPATAAAIEDAAFSAADLRDGRVSVRALRAAGVDPGVAGRLRREYGLRWTTRWHGDGQDLVRRAASLRDAPASERRWIAAAGGGPGADASGAAAAEGDDGVDDDPDWPAWPEPAAEDVGPAGVADALDGADGVETCPRCDGPLTRYALGDSVSVHCEACGYAGVPVVHGGEDAWRTAVDRLLRGERPPRRR